jgi:hypothetical protein
MELTTQRYRGIIHNHSACSGEGSHPLSVLRQGKQVCLRMGREFLRACGKHPE